MAVRGESVIAAGQASAAPGSAATRGGFRLPLVGHLSAELDSAEKARTETLARELGRRDPRLAFTAAFGPRTAVGLGPWPNLVLEDHSGISLYNLEADRRYTYRAMLLAGEGDIVALAVEQNPAFEAYCRDTLGLGRVEVWTPEEWGVPASLSQRCASDPRFLTRVVQLAEERRGLNLVPYLGNGRAWALAREIGERTNAEIRVAAAPPRLTRCANNKLWFEARVEELLGRSALPEVRFANGPALLAHHVRDLARRYASVAIKMPSAASSLGNIVLEAAALAGRPLSAVRDELCGLLAQAGWRPVFPLLVTAWEQPIIASPSVQVWIPDRSDGLPVIEGIFQQSLAGAVRAFVGAAPSDLSLALQRQIAREAMQLAYLLQALGYFGRCSFDAILLDGSPSGPRVHWIEANARWGGVSIPMTLVNRLVGDWARRPFVVAQGRRPGGRSLSFSDVVRQLGERLYGVGQRDRGIVILSPGALDAGAGYDFITLAGSIAEAEELADEAVALLA